MKLRIQKIDGRVVYLTIINSDAPPPQLVLFGIEPKGVFRWTLPSSLKVEITQDKKIAIED